MAILSINVANLQSTQAQEQLSISANVSYDDENTEITGTVLDETQTPVEGAKVSIQVDNPDGSPLHFALIYTDTTGSFVDKFKTPEDINGECSVYITASKVGYGTGMNQVTYTAIPEFSMLLVPFIMIALLFLVNAMQKRKI